MAKCALACGNLVSLVIVADQISVLVLPFFSFDLFRLNPASFIHISHPNYALNRNGQTSESLQLMCCAHAFNLILLS
jgi:hypothetical protein